MTDLPAAHFRRRADLRGIGFMRLAEAAFSAMGVGLAVLSGRREW